MAQFQYKAFDAEQRLVDGQVEAESLELAVAQLAARGLNVRSIGGAPDESAAGLHDAWTTSGETEQTSPHPRARRGVGAEQAVLRSHMAKVLEQGKTIVPALRAYTDEMPWGWQRRQLRSVCQVLETGDVANASTALMALPDYWIPLLSAAAASNDPGLALREFLAESRQADEFRRQRWLSFAYPFLVLSVAVIVLAILSIFIIPVFRGIFNEFDLELPMLTMVVLKVSGWLAAGGIAIVAVLLIAIGALLFNSQREIPWSVSRWLVDRLAVPYGRRTATARFARFTAHLLEAGLSLPDALRIAGFSSNRRALKMAAWHMADELAADRDDTIATSQRKLSPAVVYALRHPMPDTSRIRLLRELSDCHTERARLRLSWASGIIEPITICVVGMIVGLTVLALFLPLVKLIEGLTS